MMIKIKHFEGKSNIFQTNIFKVSRRVGKNNTSYLKFVNYAKSFINYQGACHP